MLMRLKMKNIGILTLHNALNYGAFLQAFALQTVLQEQGHQVKIIDLSKNRLLDRLWLIKCKYPKKMIHHYKLLKQFDKVADKLKITRSNPNDFDTVIVGSDEVWNLANNFTHYPQYLGKGISVPNLISYAVSANILTPGQFKQLAGEECKFSEFKHISVRDSYTYRLVKEVSCKEPALVSDPTLLLSEWKNWASPCPDKNFIFLYEMGIKESEKEKVQQFAKQTGKQIISMGCDLPWCDKNLYGTPFDFLGYMKAADYVITSQFHGVMFSVIFNKEVSIFPQNKSKVLDAMDWLSLTDRDATNIPDLQSVFSKPMDYVRINKLAEQRRKESLSWLFNNI